MFFKGFKEWVNSCPVRNQENNNKHACFVYLINLIQKVADEHVNLIYGEDYGMYLIASQEPIASQFTRVDYRDRYKETPYHLIVNTQTKEKADQERLKVAGSVEENLAKLNEAGILSSDLEQFIEKLFTEKPHKKMILNDKGVQLITMAFKTAPAKIDEKTDYLFNFSQKDSFTNDELMLFHAKVAETVKWLKGIIDFKFELLLKEADTFLENVHTSPKTLKKTIDYADVAKKKAEEALNIIERIKDVPPPVYSGKSENNKGISEGKKEASVKFESSKRLER